MFSILSTLIVSLPIVANAATSGIYTYTVSGGEAIITECDYSADGAIVIPSTLGGCPVTSIGENAFSFCNELTDVYNYKAFVWNKNLQPVTQSNEHIHKK